MFATGSDLVGEDSIADTESNHSHDDILLKFYKENKSSSESEDEISEASSAKSSLSNRVQDVRTARSNSEEGADLGLHKCDIMSMSKNSTTVTTSNQTLKPVTAIKHESHESDEIIDLTEKKRHIHQAYEAKKLEAADAVSLFSDEEREMEILMPLSGGRALLLTAEQMKERRRAMVRLRKSGEDGQQPIERI